MHTQTLTKPEIATACPGRNDKSRAGCRVAGEVSDETLVERIAGGDRAAMHVLYVRHHVRIYRFLVRLTGNATMAEDVVSDTFLDAWRSAEHFEKKSSVSTWLLAIARYKALSQLRQRPSVPLDERADAVRDSADDPETTAHKSSRSAIVRKCLSQLSSAHREVMDLVYYQDKSIEEVGRIVCVSPNTVKTRMFYARSRMAGLLQESGIAGM
jgi:RNA polymerase sigma-70 factor, ECF subfamily